MEEHSAAAQNTPKNGGKLSPEQDLNRRKCLALKRKCDGLEGVRNKVYQLQKLSCLCGDRCL